MCNEIRTTRKSSVRSIDIKDKPKNTFNENIVFKKVNGSKSNTEQVMSKKSDKIIVFANI